MKIAIFGKSISQGSYSSFENLLNVLHSNNIQVVLYSMFYQFLAQNTPIKIDGCDTFSNHHELKQVDLMITFGGDGTFLEAITHIGASNIPMVGINSGRLGFLASINQNEINEAINCFAKREYNIRELSLLEVKSTDSSSFNNFPYALNELAIHKRDSASMITIHAHINGEFLTSYWADGLLIATPTGSTAYSLSLGGPIVHPYSNSIILNPIAPHNLNVRPLIIPADGELQLRIEGRGDTYLASLDSRSFQFNHSVELIVKQASFKIKVLELKNHSFYATLRNKLMWGSDRRNS